MERRAQVKSLQQQVTELRSSQGKRGKTPVAKEKTSHPRSRFIIQIHVQGEKRLLPLSSGTHGMELPPPKREHEVGLYERPNYCLYHPFLVRKDAPPSRIDCRDTVGMQIDSK
ncbi:UNVERIFIED_CONTAM: hypothetical protein Slati_4554300 [Sesamum latifolium]|uniref:Uncharacterized protein n=1 Tax=Sesamum latifolium TaxID=2727402 RepID=A0AAW2S2B2_9LAMI